ncbi:hypothetical protein EJ06DRAFT_220276 [Trichodelitschia bisporula]|uniref:Uncharacterized protein n=1 Tax=Trichodelitschia bisporula TaxID=703511 RepID=A0A6G1IA06_9PEZI|nr:hypothetical protein EJ06DRAFT_220276 [Trichodelitschia bisporula]
MSNRIPSLPLLMKSKVPPIIGEMSSRPSPIYWKLDRTAEQGRKFALNNIAELMSAPPHYLGGNSVCPTLAVVHRIDDIPTDLQRLAISDAYELESSTRAAWASTSSVRNWLHVLLPREHLRSIVFTESWKPWSST